jgi:hypothetical protein
MFCSLMRVGALTVGITNLLPQQEVQMLAGILPHAAPRPAASM